MLHFPIFLPNLKVIQTEIKIGLKYASDIIGIENLDTLGTTNISYIDTETLKKYTPSLIEFLKELNLHKRWDLTFFSVAGPLHRMMIHTDFEWTSKDLNYYGLNIPLNDCSGTYFIWYRHKNKEIVPDVEEYKSHVHRVVYRRHNLSDMTPIDKMERSNTSFVNISTPHNVISFSKQSSSILSVRFHPDLTLKEVEKIVKKIGP